jgi:hypothetical protein
LAGELRAVIVGSALALVVACGASTSQQGGLEVVVRTNLPAGAFDHLRVKVEQESSPGGSWITQFDFIQDIAAVTFPARVSIAAGTAADQEARVTAVALLGMTDVVVEDIAQVQVPTDRVGELDLLLSEECVGKTCGANQTCDPATGLCISNVVNTVATFQEDGGTDAMAEAGPGTTSSGTTGTSTSSSGAVATSGPGTSSGRTTSGSTTGMGIGSSSGFGISSTSSGLGMSSSSGMGVSSSSGMTSGGTTGTSTTSSSSSSSGTTIGSSSGPKTSGIGSSSGPTGGIGSSSGPTGGIGSSSGVMTGGGPGSSSGPSVTTGSSG